jgi:hypothetical protein
MDMIDFYNQEQALEALEEARETKKTFLAEIEKLDQMIFILEYFLNTGDALDPAAFGFEDPEEEDE